MNYRIPFHKPFTIGKELDYIAQAVLSGGIAGDAAFTRKCQALLEHRLSAKKVFLAHSCTAALEMSALLCEIAEGDEGIVKSVYLRVGPQEFWRTSLVDCADDMVVEEDVVEAEFFDSKTDLVDGIRSTAEFDLRVDDSDFHFSPRWPASREPV